MRTRCPQCGKMLNLSVAELEASGGMVICPQCVSSFHIAPEDIQQAAEQEQDTPATSTEAVESVPIPSQGVAFCYHCGKHLPAQGLNFCPFCGGSLALTPQQVEPVPVQPQQEEASSVVEAVEAAEAKKKAQAERDAQNRKGLDNLNSMKHMQRRLVYRQEPAGKAFKWFFAYPVIAALIAVFIYLVVLINQ